MKKGSTGHHHKNNTIFFYILKNYYPFKITKKKTQYNIRMLFPFLQFRFYALEINSIAGQGRKTANSQSTPTYLIRIII